MKSESPSQTGFQRLLDDLQCHIQPDSSLSASLTAILTLGGRQLLSFGLQSLSAEHTALFELVPDAKLQTRAGGGSESPDTTIWQLGIWNYGRLQLAQESPDDAECRMLGQFAISPQRAEAVAVRTEALQRAASRCDAQMASFYDALDGDALKKVLVEVHEAVDHTDPVLLYINDTTISNFGKFNNLQERNGANLPHCFFRRVAQLPCAAAWTHDERIFVFCFHWLIAAACRGEEFNGRQLNPATLDAYFDTQLQHYRAAALPLFEREPLSIAEKAVLLAECKRYGAKEMLTYRSINGLNFCKEECVRARSEVPVGLATLTSRLGDYLTQTYGVVPGRHDSLGGLFTECIERMADAEWDCGEADLNGIERLLKMITEDAIEATRSDVGMTRGFRALARWQDAFRNERYDEICGWPAADYYCGVFPSQALFSRLQDMPEHLVKILTACSVRMQFNSWHYMPGHCPRDAVPGSRHFYYPPRLPDVAVWSDQHHAGHVLAEVRFSIRSPAPLELDGKVYPGMVDLRLFRQRGDAFDASELSKALAFTEQVRALNQALSDHVARGGSSVRIGAFDKEWFRRTYGEQHEPTCPAATHALVLPPHAEPASVMQEAL